MWTGLISLKVLNLKNNALDNLPPSCFKNLTKLRVLHLQDNGLDSIRGEFWEGLHLLKELYLNGNHITMVHPGGFSHLRHLIKLRLEKNNLVTLNADVFNPDDYPESDGHPSRLQLSLNQNPLQCNNDLCWLREAEKRGWLIWLDDIQPQCDVVDWRNITEKCSTKGKQDFRVIL